MKVNLSEHVRMAFGSIMTHKLRAFLTLVGIIVGVASIISVMTAIELIQSKMEDDMSQLGSSTFQVQKWPAMGTSHKEWRRIVKRKPLTIENANIIRERVKSVDLVGAELWDFAQTLSHEKEKTNPNVTIAGGTPEFQYNNNQLVAYGRFITEEDVKVGRKVIVLGTMIVNKLFPFKDPLDQVVKLNGQKYRVIGILEELGERMFGSGDNYAVIPISTFVRSFGDRDNRGRERSVNITINVKPEYKMENAIEEVRYVLRAARKVNPVEEDDFDIFSNDSMVRAFGDMTKVLRIVVFAMALISLAVAGIGIMNIMLVSVTERTKEIGIRKAIGAKKNDIVKQFLIEAIVLCEFGGLIGIIVGVALGNLVSVFVNVAVNIPTHWIIFGFVLCSLIGIVFGLWPAYRASKLDPIESLRYE